MKLEDDAGPARRPRKRWRYVAGLFLLLLIVSHALRQFGGPPNHPRPDQQRTLVHAVDHGEINDETVWMAYSLLEPDLAKYPNPPTLLLLHGSPMASSSMMTLAHALPDSFRIIIPDLPGFGGSSLQIPDYSIDAHSYYVSQLLDTLGVDKAHHVAYSMSGGVALHVYEKRPELVESIIMLSAIGVQELELLGSYPLNHAVHGFQLAFLWALQELFPHMGYMDDALLNTAYARNFYDSDQRPLRGILSDVNVPMLIIHGKEDMQVPLAAAVEHERIVPQSTLALFDGGHGLVFNPSDPFLESLTSFVMSVEDESALTRKSATEERISRAAEPFDNSYVPKAEGLTLLVFMLLIAIATLFSEDATCIGAGLLVAQGTLDFVPATLACLIGIVVGDSLLFFAGRYISGPMLSRAPIRWFISKESLEDASEWLSKRGATVIIASRFVPGSRVPTYIAAGSLGLSFWKFLFYFMVASIVWTPMLVGMSVVFGDQLLMRFLAIYEGYALLIFIGLILGILGIMKVVVPLFSHQGRRMMVGSWKRKTQWEFWPIWALYFPVVFYIAYLSIRYRSVTLFTGANPGIDLGGLVGESKSSILCNLMTHSENVASFTLVKPADSIQKRTHHVLDFMEGTGVDYPLILKPDVGERGKGVVKVKDEEEIRAYFLENKEAAIAQEYAPGQEFGVFYYRYPREPKGQIFSITDKQFPEVVGDGKRTLHRLILDDERAVAMAKHYFKANHHHLFDVPEAGEAVKLVDIGTHARGAIFLDGAAIITPELEEVIDSISQRYNGFYFGRFDIRTPSVDAFKSGKNFKVVELNGVTSEATHIYDPSLSLLNAYRTLMKQWQMAFEIGDQNRRNGIPPASLLSVLRRLWGMG